MLDSQARQETTAITEPFHDRQPFQKQNTGMVDQSRKGKHANAVDISIQRLVTVVSTPESHLYRPGRVDEGTISESPHEANPGRLHIIDHSDRSLTAPRHRQ